MSEVIIGFQIWNDDGESDDRELLGVFTSVDRFEKVVDALDPERSEDSVVCFYIAELDAPGSEAQWELFKTFPGLSLEDLQARREQEAIERKARIDRNREEFLKNS